MRAPRVSASLLLCMLAVACGSEEQELVMSRPYFATVLPVPDLVGEVVVSRDDGAGGLEEVARATLALEGETAHAVLPDLPTGVDLLVSMRWRSGDIDVAVSTEAKSVRVQQGKTADLAFGEADYSYPDDDGDGAANIAEVVYASERPQEGAGAVGDAGKVPPGFFSGLVGAPSIVGVVGSVDAGAAGNHVLASTVMPRETDPITYDEHQIHMVDMENRRRRTISLDCPDNDLIWDIEVNRSLMELQAVCSCYNRVFFITASAVDFDIVHIADLPALTPVQNLVFSRSGRRLYALQPARSQVTVLDTGSYDVVATLDSTLLGEEASVVDLVDTGDRLLMLDAGRDGIAVVSHEDDGDFALVGVALQGELAGPFRIALHPAGHRAYVGSRADGKLRVLDIAPDDPAEWRVIATVDVSGVVADVEIEPLHGSWVYALGEDQVVRVDTLTNRVGWDQPLGGEGFGAATDLSLDQDGTEAVVTGGDAMGFVVLGHPDPANIESEPNEAVAQVTGSAGVVGPAPGRVVGWGSMSEQGEVSADLRIWNGGATGSWVDFSEDIEDLWRIDTAGVTGRLAVGVMPTSTYAQQTVSLVSAAGDVIDTAFFGLETAHLTPGTGVFLISPPVTELGEGVMAGVSMQDFDRTVNYSYYELIVQEVPDPFPSVDEVEPNNDFDGAQPIFSFPVTVNGRVEASDQGVYTVFGSEDVEDCYYVRTDHTRVAARLDFDEPADIDMVILDAEGQRVPNTYAVWGAGGTEFFAFEPAIVDSSQFLVCVLVEDHLAVNEADYSLTLVDFGY